MEFVVIHGLVYQKSMKILCKYLGIIAESDGFVKGGLPMENFAVWAAFTLLHRVYRNGIVGMLFIKSKANSKLFSA
jgi:hypothetical protein